MLNIGIDQLPMSFLSSELDDELSSQPLVRFKLTTWKKTGDTSLSFAWSHVLGSGKITEFATCVIDLKSQVMEWQSGDSCLRGQITTKISAL